MKTNPMEFKVASRREIERGIVVRTAYVVISITDPDQPRPEIRKPSGFRDVLYLQFHDAEPDDASLHVDDVILMSKEDAKAIWAFVLRYRVAQRLKIDVRAALQNRQWVVCCWV
jgi:hypothetical protein